jgi:dTDP-4-amino-4,6-dideoxygalactose transaminase
MLVPAPHDFRPNPAETAESEHSARRPESSWPLEDAEVWAALQAVYASGDWGRYHGAFTARLAEQLAALHGVEHVFLCSSGTLAVELALRGLKVGPGDEVILAGYDFAGNFRAVESVGARPVLADIDPRNWCLTTETIEPALSEQTRAVIVSHLHGGLAPLEAIHTLAVSRHISVIEDACQSPGATVQGRPAGTWGDVGILSFGGSKLLTAGRGGAVLTNRADVLQRIKVYCERGNHAFPLSELQAAVLGPQVEKLAARNRKRGENVEWLLERCRGFQFLRPLQNPPGAGIPSYYKLAWLYEGGTLGGRSREQFLGVVQAEGVAVDVGFHGFVKRPASRCRKIGDLRHSARAAEATVLLHHPILLQPREELERVTAAFHKVQKAWQED